ncbi:MAG: hypothetical protein FWF29_01020 [Treponema sp.]|nr:hypothetical protein [Treponema sp.]
MVDRALIDTLNIKSRDFSVRWKELIRKTPHCKKYNDMDDISLVELNRPVYPLLARCLDRGLDRSLIGDFFVTMGKDRLHMEFPVSEVIFGINLTEKVVIEYMMADYASDNPVQMYQSMDAVTKIAEFFLLGSFYLTKGFLEETYTTMKGRDNISDELLKKYFKDDFFFKN